MCLWLQRFTACRGHPWGRYVSPDLRCERNSKQQSILERGWGRRSGENRPAQTARKQLCWEVSSPGKPSRSIKGMFSTWWRGGQDFHKTWGKQHHRPPYGGCLRKKQERKRACPQSLLPAGNSTLHPGSSVWLAFLPKVELGQQCVTATGLLSLA